MSHFVNRVSKYAIQPFFLSRVSSRAFSEERLTEDELMSLFEAARWAPSSYNNQPWRFIYVRRGEHDWNLLFDTLIDFNKSWCKNADTLVLILSRKNFTHNEKISKTSQLDAGAAWMSLALEAEFHKIVAHGMEGFDYEAARKNLGVSDKYTIEAMAAIGKQGEIDILPEALQEKEIPTLRKPLSEIISNGKFIFE
jgi:nitroreductase